MIREFCDTCKKPIQESEFMMHPGEDFKRWTVTRIVIAVAEGPDRDHAGGQTFNTTTDVLCPDCAKKWRYED